MESGTNGRCGTDGIYSLAIPQTEHSVRSNHKTILSLIPDILLVRFIFKANIYKYRYY